MGALLTTWAILLLTPVAIHAQTRGRPGAGTAVEIKIETSRSQITPGTGLGVMAEITNLSGETIYLHEKHTTLDIPPELGVRVRRGKSWWAHFPTEVHRDKSDPYDTSIAIRPGEAYKVLWVHLLGEHPLDGRAPPRFFGRTLAFGRYVLDVVFSELNFLFFSPGTYTITVSLKYWTQPTLPDTDYHVAVKSSPLQVAAPQFVVLLGAATGGLLAYLLLPHARRRLIDQAGGRDIAKFRRVVTEVAGIAGAILFSMVMTILMSRIAETQFVIRVTVTDFWGAIAVGFVANWLGSALLQKLAPLPGEVQAAPGTPPAAQGATASAATAPARLPPAPAPRPASPADQASTAGGPPTNSPRKVWWKPWFRARR